MGESQLCEYELLRQKNIEENLNMMRELGILNTMFSPSEADTPSPKRRAVRSRRNSGQKLSMTQKRRSKRLSARRTVQFSHEVSKQILGNEDKCNVTVDDDDNAMEKDCEEEHDKRGSKRPRPKRRTSTVTREVPSVDEITDEDINNIAEHVRDKQYSQEGTTCHQCRQKTLDQKTICRADECAGVRGQFCGPCLRNRYGESVAEALRDPDWKCPPCRGLCNCSICRTHAGKMPTGQMTYFAHQRGFDSVRHFLDKEEGDE